MLVAADPGRPDGAERGDLLQQAELVFRLPKNVLQVPCGERLQEDEIRGIGRRLVVGRGLGCRHDVDHHGVRADATQAPDERWHLPDRRARLLHDHLDLGDSDGLQGLVVG